MRRTFIAAVLGAWALVAGVAAANPPIPTTGQTFSEDFTTLDRVTASNPKGRWQTAFTPLASNSLAIASRSLTSNGEQELYVDPEFAGVQCGINPTTGQPQNLYGRPGWPGNPSPCYTQPGTAPLGLNPFKLLPNVGLGITADKLAPNALTWNMPYASGLLTTRTSFAQTYGYFEVVAQIPPGKGLWPAFWLLNANGKWPPELDVIEMGDQDVHTVRQSVHSNTLGTPNWHSYASVQAANLSGGFHAYGLAWNDTNLVWYVDGVETHREPTPADINQPMYLLLNLAVGGSWGAIGYPDNTTPFPSTLYVASVKAWSIPNGPVPAATLPVGPLPPPVLPPPPPPPPKRSMTVTGTMGGSTFTGTLTEQ